MKIATWNVNSLRVRLPQVLDWLAYESPDILALQETKIPDLDFPLAALTSAGYSVVYQGQKAYNGVAILTRGEMGKEIMVDVPRIQDPQRRILALTYKNIRVLNVYVPNGQTVGSEKYFYKLDWLEKIKAHIREELTRYEHFVVLGDFNIAPGELDVHEPLLWYGRILFSDKEREALRALMDLGLTDCFRFLSPTVKDFTWWDYRLNAFKRNLGLRIDHILVSESLRKRCLNSYVDRKPRAHTRPSDHAPMVANFDSFY